MSDPIRFPLSASNRVRLDALNKQAAQIEHDRKLIVDSILGMQWAPGDPLWNAAIRLEADAIVATPVDIPEASA
jgi:hypothetical protein